MIWLNQGHVSPSLSHVGWAIVMRGIWSKPWYSFYSDWYSAWNSIVLLMPKRISMKILQNLFHRTNGHLIWEGLRNLCQRLRWSITLIFNNMYWALFLTGRLHIARIPPSTVNGASGDRKVNPYCRAKQGTDIWL